MNDIQKKLKDIAEELIPLATKSEILARLKRAEQLRDELLRLSIEEVKPQSGIGSIMDENAWRTALMGLCVGTAKEHSTPSKAADNVRARIALAATTGKMPFGPNYLFNLATNLSDAYTEAAQLDGFAEEGFNEEQRALHIKWMMAAISKHLEEKDE